MFCQFSGKKGEIFVGEIRIESNAKVVRMSEAPAPARASVVQMSGTPVTEDEIVPGSWRAPVARMY
jgi:hypothetical protein